MKNICIVAGARPNYMKVAPLIRYINTFMHDHISYFLVNTGQHYDHSMSKIFLKELGIPEPDFNLNSQDVDSASMISRIENILEEICQMKRPDMMVVVGDVNSTLAAALAANKLELPLAHIEAGLRSRDETMPEERNRITIDALSNLLFTSEREANDNPIAEGILPNNIYFVGQIMIDNLKYQLRQLQENGASKEITTLKSNITKEYLCMTLHRQSNVDNPRKLQTLLTSMEDISQHCPVLFPCHPRTYEQIKKHRFMRFFREIDIKSSYSSGILLCPPLSYNSFLYLWKDAIAVVTDSGGLQEETTALSVPCLTVRENTERPATIDVGSNTLVGNNYGMINELLYSIVKGNYKHSGVPELWDGQTSGRIMRIIEKFL